MVRFAVPKVGVDLWRAGGRAPHGGVAVRSKGRCSELWPARAVDKASSGASAAGSGSPVALCGGGKWAAVAPATFTLVRVPVDLARCSGCC